MSGSRAFPTRPRGDGSATRVSGPARTNTSSPARSSRNDPFTLPGEDVEFRRLSRNSGAIKLPKTGEVSRERIRLSHRHAEDEARRENVSDWTPSSSVCAARNPSAVCGLSLGHRMESTWMFRWQNRRWMCSCSSRSAAIRLPFAVQDRDHVLERGATLGFSTCGPARLRASHETALLDRGAPVQVVAKRCGPDPAVSLLAGPTRQTPAQPRPSQQ
jgi:hypothetical protein